MNDKTQTLRPQAVQPMTDEWVSAAERVPLESDGEVFVRFTDGSIGTAWATYWHGASNAFAQWTHPDQDEYREISHWMKPPGITAQADLWCIHIPGPSEVHAAPSKEDAEHMAERHNKAMADYYASKLPNLECAPSIESVQALVIKWPHDPESHADEMREFDWAGWGITAQDKEGGNA